MLRATALALLVANGLCLAWGQGLLSADGHGPARQSEPEVLARQIRPEAMQLLPANPVPPVRRPTPAAVSMAVPVPEVVSVAATNAQCLQVGVFTEQQAHALRPRLRSSLPEGSWSFESSGDSVHWIIYMGKYISKEAMNRKRRKLQQLGLAFEPPISPLLNPGLSLGSFGSRAEAQAALEQMNARGIRSARVVLERPELPSLWLKVPAADTAMRSRLDTLKPLLAGKAVQACQ
ncbi:MAG: putative signal peptide protein [Polaromonas sp.]|nr:putative signal peptide protein [Polaromonas sp.]